MTEFIEENFRTMADTKITIIYKENEDHITDISFTAERNYTPIFTEAFFTQEKPLSVHLSKIKIYSARMLQKVVQSKSYLILQNLSVTA